MPQNIRQNIVFENVPSVIYELLMDPEKHSLFTDAEAKINREIGGKVFCYNNYIEAINVELAKDTRMVQAWRGTDWNEGEWSLVVFNLQKSGNTTLLTFEQYGIPDKHAKSIENGWEEHYWSKMKNYI